MKICREHKDAYIMQMRYVKLIDTSNVVSSVTKKWLNSILLMQASFAEGKQVRVDGLRDVQNTIAISTLVSGFFCYC